MLLHVTKFARIRCHIKWRTNWIIKLQLVSTSTICFNTSRSPPKIFKATPGTKPVPRRKRKRRSRGRVQEQRPPRSILNRCRSHHDRTGPPVLPRRHFFGGTFPHFLRGFRRLRRPAPVALRGQTRALQPRAEGSSRRKPLVAPAISGARLAPDRIGCTAESWPPTDRYYHGDVVVALYVTSGASAEVFGPRRWAPSSGPRRSSSGCRGRAAERG